MIGRPMEARRPTAMYVGYTVRVSSATIDGCVVLSILRAYGG